MSEALRTNHNVRIVSLANRERVLCMFGEVRSEDKEKVVGYRMSVSDTHLTLPTIYSV